MWRDPVNFFGIFVSYNFPNLDPKNIFQVDFSHHQSHLRGDFFSDWQSWPLETNPFSPLWVGKKLFPTSASMPRDSPLTAAATGPKGARTILGEVANFMPGFCRLL